MWAHPTHISSNRERFCDRSEAVSVAFLALVLHFEVPSAEDFKRQCMGAMVLDCRLARAINSSAEVHSGVNTARPSWTPGSSGINADSRALKRSVTDSAPSAPAWTSTTAIMPVRSLPSRSDALSSGRTAAATVSKVMRAWESGSPAPIKTSPSPRLNRLARSTSSWMRRSNTDVSGSASTARGLNPPSATSANHGRSALTHVCTSATAPGPSCPVPTRVRSAEVSGETGIVTERWSGSSEALPPSYKDVPSPTAASCRLAPQSATDIFALAAPASLTNSSRSSANA